VRARAAAAAAAAAIATGAWGASQAAAADPILPLSEVRPGMVGEARTVLDGHQIVTFPVTVLDVVSTGVGPDSAPQIKIRAEGPLIEETGGIAAGMSGSPIYVTGTDGVPRVIGAVAYGLGDRDQVLGLATPIEQMVASDAGGRAPASIQSLRPSRKIVLARDRAAAVRIERRRPGTDAAYPLARWTIAGATGPLAKALGRSLRASGVRLEPTAALALQPAGQLVPGAKMSVGLIEGDVVAGATGTVTYVDGTKVLGFGHPFLGLGAGRTSLLMGDGFGLGPVPNPILGGSYIDAEIGPPQGTLVADRAAGATGYVGAVDAITAVGEARDVDRGVERTVRVTIGADPRLAPLFAGVAQDEPAFRAADGVAAGTITVNIAIAVEGRAKPVTYRNVYASAGDVPTFASGVLQRMVAVLLQNGLRQVPIQSISVDETLESRVRAARILGATVRPARVRPDRRAVLALRLQPWRAAPRVVRIPFRLPAGLDSGRSRLRVIPAQTGGFDPVAADFTQSLLGESAFKGTVRRAESIAERASGSRTERLIRALGRVLDKRHDAVRVLGPGEDADDRTAGVLVPVPYVISGGQASARVHKGRGG
jgi:hypothetical protein